MKWYYIYHTAFLVSRGSPSSCWVAFSCVTLSLSKSDSSPPNASWKSFTVYWNTNIIMSTQNNTTRLCWKYGLSHKFTCDFKMYKLLSYSGSEPLSYWKLCDLTLNENKGWYHKTSLSFTKGGWVFFSMLK